jgi:hypothetical protein
LGVPCIEEPTVIPPSAFHLLQDPDAVALTGRVYDVPPVIVTRRRGPAVLWALMRRRREAQLSENGDVAYVTE